MPLDLRSLNPAQKEAVEYLDGSSLVIAGAGSGKTRVLTYKLAYLLEQGYPPYRLMALTFTNKAAEEMRQRVAKLVGDKRAQQIWMGTFHSVFSRILRIEGHHLGFNPDYTIWDTADSKSALGKVVDSLGLDKETYKPANLHQAISRAKNALILPEDYAANKELIEADEQAGRPHTSLIYAHYTAFCQQSNALDFDDLLLQTFRLFHLHPQVLEHYAQRFLFLLVDEYQDTNYAQHRVVQQLASIHQRVCVVGDDAQSIYSFRGANIHHILGFQEQFPQAKLFKLEQNYRSTQTIVQAANSLIKNNRQQIPKEVYSQNEVGSPLQLLSSYSGEEEAQQVVGRIQSLYRQGGLRYQDIALLYRTNAQSRSFEEVLRQQGVPYRLFGGTSFYQRKEIKDLLAYFKLAVNPKDQEALSRCINYPKRGIGNTTLAKLLSTTQSHQVAAGEVLAKPADFQLPVNSGTLKKLQAFHSLLNQAQEDAQTLTAYPAALAITKASGIPQELGQDNTPEGKDRRENIDELLSQIQQFDQRSLEEGTPSTLVRFLQEVALLTDQDSEALSTDWVNLLTIHASKGLEFSYVFVVGLEEGLFPSERSSSRNELEEERRLFYVALTRAEKKCFCSYAKTRFRYGQFVSSRPSRFIYEIDNRLLNYPQMEVPPQVHSQSQTPVVKKSPGSLLNGLLPKSPSGSKLSKTTSVARQAMQSIGSLHIGSKIIHERFGEGLITALEGSDQNAKATVQFQHFGEKQLLLKFAKFQIVS